MSLDKNEILIGPDEGAYLPVLDIIHKVTAEASGGSLRSRSGVSHPAR